jgi:hypothetical protein
MPTTSVRRRISLFSRSCGLLLQICPPDLARVGGEGQQVGAGRLEVLGRVAVRGLEGVDDAVVLGGDGVGVGLVKDGADLGGHVRLRRLGHLGQQVAQVVPATALPGRAGQRRRDRGHESGLGVGDDQLHPGQTAGDQPAQKRQPARAVLGRGDVQAEDLPVPEGSGGYELRRASVNDRRETHR